MKKKKTHAILKIMSNTLVFQMSSSLFMYTWPDNVWNAVAGTMTGTVREIAAGSDFTGEDALDGDGNGCVWVTSVCGRGDDD